jgi:RimJ/RimL family protein N-acetyltransferase
MTDAPSEFFTEEARAEFDKSISLTTFALTMSEEGENLFVGEGVLYKFDYEGGCEVGVRVLPEYGKRGYGRAILSGMLRIAEKIGVCRVFARVYRDNVPANKLFRKIMNFSFEADGILYYELEL